MRRELYGIRLQPLPWALSSPHGVARQGDKAKGSRTHKHIHRRRMKGMLVMRHWDWILWCPRQGSEQSERMGGTCLLDYYFTFSTILFFDNG